MGFSCQADLEQELKHRASQLLDAQNGRDRAETHQEAPLHMRSRGNCREFNET